GQKRLRMAEFYKLVRKRFDILLEDDESPVGGQWSFDEDNRRKLPAKMEPPPIAPAEWTAHTDDVVAIVEQRFDQHPGDARDFWWPTTRSAAQAWLERFVEERLTLFGPYEDAISTRSDTVYHSALTPALNLGLLTPRQVVDAALDKADQEDIPLQSLEGFIRQVIGWREFVRGVYRCHGERQSKSNFFGHDRRLTSAWYDGTTGLPPLDDTIGTANRLGWTHHIPRLMVVGNLMTLCEIHPQDAHRWFMEMYVDSSEWVMGPNVYGMGIFSDGGVFATKPYICGSNYLRKMSDYKKGDWCDTVDGLYWRFIGRHRDFFAGNPRLALMPRALDRLSSERRDTIFAAAETFLDRYTGEAE
ncbi:MAG: cryptochrome/photolyase family protein, partial [Pseudomonadota bacterium]